MKIFLIADGSSSHTEKWVLVLLKHNIKVYLFTLNKISANILSASQNNQVEVYSEYLLSEQSFLSKISYLKVVPRLKKEIKRFKPNIVHAHYASSYGLLGALSSFHPFVLSVWGSDVYDFPKKSILHKMILKWNLRKADLILSTSNVMARETNKYTDKKIEVTPFGVDLNVFKPYQVHRVIGINNEDIVIGTIKTLESKYGIEYLIRAFKVLKERDYANIKLLIVGKGTLKDYLNELVKSLNIEDYVVFQGWIPFDEVVKFHNMLDIAVYPSILDSESFGVSVVESGACEVPVVVANKGGLVEVVEENVTGFVAQAKNHIDLADKIELLLRDEKLRIKMGKSARERVKKMYSWKDNASLMINKYESLKNQ